MKHTAKHFWELLLLMTQKELRVRYKYTIFGFFWLVANPLLQMLVIGFVFTFFMKEPITNYYYYLFLGLLTWNFFSLSLTKTTSSIVFERSLIKKSLFPRAVIPLSIVLSNAVNFFSALILYCIPVLFLGTMHVFSIIPIIGGLFLLFGFTIGLSLLTSALNVRFRDVTFFVQAILIIWFYATPIVYSFTMIPHQYRWLWMLNPLTSAIQLLQYGFVGAVPPDFVTLVANASTIAGVFFFGIIFFQIENKNFDDWI